MNIELEFLNQTKVKDATPRINAKKLEREEGQKPSKIAQMALRLRRDQILPDQTISGIKSFPIRPQHQRRHSKMPEKHDSTSKTV